MKGLTILQLCHASVLLDPLVLFFLSPVGRMQQTCSPAPSLSLTHHWHRRQRRREVSMGPGPSRMRVRGIFDKILWSGDKAQVSRRDSERFRQLSPLFHRTLGFKFLSRLETPTICPLTSPGGACRVTCGFFRHPYLFSHRGQSLSRSLLRSFSA